MISRRLPALVGFAVLVLGIAIVLAVGGGPARRDLPARVAVPRVFPGYSHLTADAARYPLGRAVALYDQGSGVQVTDTPQALALGSDGRTTRTLGAALGRGRGPADAPAPVALSPDGLHVAVGEHQASSPTDADLVVVDAAGGDARVLDVPDVPGVDPVAWSRDSRYLAYLGTSTVEGAASTPVGPLYVLDTTTGAAVAVADDVAAAAFSPDGSRIAVQSRGSQQIRVLDRSGRSVEQLLAPAGTRVAGGDAWSPDGSLIAVLDATGDRVAFVPVAATVVLPAPLRTSGRVLGWLSPTEVLVPAPATSWPTGDFRVLRADLTSGDTSVWTSVPTSGGNDAVSDVTLATALLPQAHLDAPGDVDRGPWPLGVRVGFVVAGAVLSLVSTIGLQRRSERVRAVLATPTWSSDTAIG